MWLCIAHEIRRRDVERWDGEQVSRGKALHSVQRTRSSLPLMLGVFLFFFSRVSCPSYVCVCFAVEVCWKVCLLESLLNQTKVEQGVLWEHFSFQMKSDENTPVITCESSTWSWKHRCVCVCVFAYVSYSSVFHTLSHAASITNVTCQPQRASVSPTCSINADALKGMGLLYSHEPWWIHWVPAVAIFSPETQQKV